ncbi:MAG: coproporphyrinogen dehydrogenase HemZ [Eubacteriaceae bacterium]|nr:coproporphyrinogen dehydrogenase HemZ [Eubacteriaceae bacterium]MDD4507824.1 coproporphyrinogen dehydrogenase HemZ [Eubacteriaceae bacterium]
MEQIAFMVADRPSYRQACFELIEAFVPGVDVLFNEPRPFSIEIDQSSDDITFRAREYDELQFIKSFKIPTGKPLDSESFKGFLYDFLCMIFNRSLPWGSLTGIKPVKIAHQYIAKEALSKEEASKKMQRCYEVSEEKGNLAASLAKRELPFLYPLDQKRVSVYVGVPICPAKCAYCSFVSTIADKKGLLCENYLNNLLYEIDMMAELVSSQNLTVDTLYIGGGTPSIFSEKQIQRLLGALKGTFIHPGLREFTFEAGRPETTTREKLEILKAYGVNRICLNPQSMNQETLDAVNRHHTARDIENTYRDIRDIGFRSINMDLIVGLNQEKPEQFFHSLDRVMALEPENITVHSLAIKKGSRMKAENGHHFKQLYTDDFYRAIEKNLKNRNYLPYYLYRQKYTQGNGENIGYAKPGYEGIYNLLMMAEKESIIGIGAGSSGKVYDVDDDRFEKVFTVKDVKTYNDRTETIVARKLDAYEAIAAKENKKRAFS